MPRIYLYKGEVNADVYGPNNGPNSNEALFTYNPNQRRIPRPMPGEGFVWSPTFDDADMAALFSYNPLMRRIAPLRPGAGLVWSPTIIESEEGEDDDLEGMEPMFTARRNPRPKQRAAKRASKVYFDYYFVVGSVTADTSNYVYGTQGLKITVPFDGTTTIHKALSLDLTKFDDAYATASVIGDIIQVWFRVDNAANFGSVRLRLTSDAVGTYTNYFETTIASARSGWNAVYIKKSDFTTHGSPSWSGITACQLQGASNGLGQVVIIFDDFRLLPAATAFTMKNVRDGDLAIGSIKFNYEQVSQCIRQIAETLGAVWYIDANRDVYFNAPASVAAPFNLSETLNADGTSNFIPDSLEIDSDMSKVRNQVFVRGGEYQGSTATYSQNADGTKANFLTPYKIKNISVTLDGVAKTVGVDNVDNPASFDCLYNFDQKNLKFASLPTVGQVVAVTGNPMLPVLIKKSDPVSIALYGVYESLVQDASITTVQGGRDRAAAELNAYRDSLVEGKFSTLTPGLFAGQVITINLPSRNIDDTYIIKQVTMRARTPYAFQYEVTLISSRTQSVIDWLFQEITKDRKNLAINSNESIDLVSNTDEEVSVADVWTVRAAVSFTESQGSSDTSRTDLDLGTMFVAGPYTMSGLTDPKRQFVLNGSLLG